MHVQIHIIDKDEASWLLDAVHMYLKNTQKRVSDDTILVRYLAPLESLTEVQNLQYLDRQGS